MAKRKVITEGMQVRVARDWSHGIKFGAVCRVTAVYKDGDCAVSGPLIDEDWCPTQYVDQALCTPLKKVRQ